MDVRVVGGTFSAVQVMQLHLGYVEDSVADGEAVHEPITSVEALEPQRHDKTLGGGLFNRRKVCPRTQ